MIKTTAMLCNELRRYANPLAKISRMMRSGELTPLIKGLYETDHRLHRPPVGHPF